MVPNDQQVTEGIKREIKKKNLETNDNENTIIQNLCDAGKAVVRGKFIAIQSYLKKQEKTSNRQPNFTYKSNWKKKRRRKKNTRGKEILKI